VLHKEEYDVLDQQYGGQSDGNLVEARPAVHVKHVDVLRVLFAEVALEVCGHHGYLEYEEVDRHYY